MPPVNGLGKQSPCQRTLTTCRTGSALRNGAERIQRTQRKLIMVQRSMHTVSLLATERLRTSYLA